MHIDKQFQIESLQAIKFIAIKSVHHLRINAIQITIIIRAPSIWQFIFFFIMYFTLFSLSVFWILCVSECIGIPAARMRRRKKIGQSKYAFIKWKNEKEKSIKSSKTVEYVARFQVLYDFGLMIFSYKYTNTNAQICEQLSCCFRHYFDRKTVSNNPL